MTSLLVYIGGTFVFAGLGLLLSMIWPDISPLQRVVITLGPGMVAFVLGIFAHRDVRFAKGATPLFLIAAFLQPSGLFVFLDEFVPKTGDPELAALIGFAIIDLQQGMAYLQLRRASLLFLTILFWLAFIGTTMAWLDVDEDIIGITVGLSTLFLSYLAAMRGHGAATAPSRRSGISSAVDACSAAPSPQSRAVGRRSSISASTGSSSISASASRADRCWWSACSA